MISVDQAFELIRQTVQPLPVEDAPLLNTVGRYLLEPVIADIASPPHDKSMMDGFAIRASDWQPGAEFEIGETIIAGAVPTAPLGPLQAARIMTGAPLPVGADAVVMVELAEVKNEQTVTFQIDSIAAEKHILRTGANFACGQRLFEAGHRVRPSDVGLLAEVGVSQARVGGLPAVAVLPTGDELVPCDQMPGPGQIRNSNGPLLLAMLAGSGLTATDLGIGRDNEDDLTAKIKTGLQHDVLILSGGVSAGQKDLVPGVLKSLGVEEVFHKVKVKPGKPIWLGIRKATGDDLRPTIVFGLPGNPVSSLVGYQLFVRNCLKIMAGGGVETPQPRYVTLSRDHQTRGNRPTYWPGRLLIDDECSRTVEPLNWNGSSDLLALGQAEGLIFFSEDQHDHPAGKSVPFFAFTDQA